MSSTYILTYHLWITQHKTPEKIRAQIKIFATELQNEINTESPILILAIPVNLSNLSLEKTPAC
jgi:hypothetical protein